MAITTSTNINQSTKLKAGQGLPREILSEWINAKKNDKT